MAAVSCTSASLVQGNPALPLAPAVAMDPHYRDACSIPKHSEVKALPQPYGALLGRREWVADLKAQRR